MPDASKAAQPADTGKADVFARLQEIDPAFSTAPENRFSDAVAKGAGAVPELLRSLEDDDPETRADAAEALGLIGDSSALAALKEHMGDPDADVRVNVAVALIRIGDDALFPEVVKALRHEDPRVVVGAAIALGRLADRRVVPNLVEAFKTDNVEVGAAVAWALGQCGDAAALPWLMTAVEQGFAVANACEALGRIGDPKAQPVLIAAFSSAADDVRAYAARAVGLSAQRRFPQSSALRLHRPLRTRRKKRGSHHCGRTFRLSQSVVRKGQVLERMTVIPLGDQVLEGLFHRGRNDPPVVLVPPHPSLGGNMDSAVLSELVWALARAGHSTLRFNYRGVGASEMAGEDASGELLARSLEDLNAAIACQLGNSGARSVALVGYSYGAHLACRAGIDHPNVDRVVLVAPPVGAFDFDFNALFSTGIPVHIFCGELDNVAPPEAVNHALDGISKAQIIPQATHAFSQGLARLAQQVVATFPGQHRADEAL
jgi:alpha/beta superfamily hydrolase